MLFICQFSFCQTDDHAKKIDSLLSVLAKTKTDTTRVNIYNELGYNYSFSKPEVALDYSKKALNLSFRKGWAQGIGNSYYNISSHYNVLGNYKEERIYLNKSLEIFKKAGDKQQMGKIYRDLGFSVSDYDFNLSMQYVDLGAKNFYDIKNYTQYCMTLGTKAAIMQMKGKNYEAAAVYQKALEVAEQHNLTSIVASATKCLGDIYSNQGKYKQALEYYKKSLAIQIKLCKGQNCSERLNLNMANAYLNLKDYTNAKQIVSQIITDAEAGDESKRISQHYIEAIQIMARLQWIAKDPTDATDYLTQAEKAVYSLNTSYVSMILLTELGDTAAAINQPQKALTYYDKAREVATAQSLAENEYSLMGKKGSVYYTLAKNSKDAVKKNAYATKAVNALKEAVQGLKKADNAGEVRNCLSYLYQAYELLNNTNDSFAYYKEYITYRDSLSNTKNQEELQAKQSEYEYNKKELLLKSEQKAALEKEAVNRRIAYGGLGVFVLISVISGLAYRRKRKDNHIIAAEKQRSDELLLNILPHEVAEELKANGEAKAQFYNEVSILFTDFVGFTTVSEQLSPTELINELNYCFKAFDHIIANHHIEKIKTIGDSYMAVSGLPVKSTDHAVNAINAALEMRDFIERYKTERYNEGKPFFEMRVGINSGEVVAGIVGIKKFAYDVWGDAVNTASRIESKGLPGKINISETTYSLTKDIFEMEYRGEIEAKGKGFIKMYFAEPKLPETNR